jgi:hypothetical protein
MLKLGRVGERKNKISDEEERQNNNNIGEIHYWSLTFI